MLWLLGGHKNRSNAPIHGGSPTKWQGLTAEVPIIKGSKIDVESRSTAGFFLENNEQERIRHKMGRKSRFFWLKTCLLTALFVTLSTKAHNLASSENFGSAVNRGRSDEAASFTDEVQFDNYSLILKGQRVFLHSGEFHTFRLPVPSLWPDILQKVKAAGLNAVSVYTHMGLINPAPGVVDFDGFRALQPLYDAAQEAGIWIVLRPGMFLTLNFSTTAINTTTF
ncbi:hypothetical protein H0H93_015139 [Arthromyces matolae]|nr:hypothetical protein H0H93_015139 [Arthromyces matolae]